MAKRARVQTQRAAASAPAPAASPRSGAGLWAALALGFILRALYLWQHRSSPFFEPSILDAGFYDEWAHRILDGRWTEGTVFYGLPLYPAFLALIYKFTASSVLAVKIVQQLLGLANVALVYALARSLFGRRSIATIAALGAAVYSPYIFHETVYIAESIGVPLYTAALWLSLRFWEKPSAPRAGAAGLCIGLAGLTKAGVFLFLPVLAVLHVFRRDAGKAGSFSRRLSAAAIILLAVIACVAPITIYNWRTSQDFVPLTAHGGLNFYLGNNEGAQGLLASPPGIRTNIEGQIADSRMIAEKSLGRRLKDSEISSFWSGKGREYLISHPRDAAVLWARKFAMWINWREISDVEDPVFARRFAPVLRFLPLDFRLLFALFVPGVLLGYRAAARGKRGVAVVWIASYTFGVLLYFVNARYRLPVVSALLPFSAFGAWHAAVSLRGGKWGSLTLAAVLFAAAFAASSPNLIEPRIGVQFTHVGNIHMRNGDFAKAIDAYRESVQTDPSYGKAYNDLGAALQAAGRRDEAEEAYRDAVKRDPDNPYAYSNLGLALDARGETAQARLLFQKALSLQPNLPEAHNNLGMSLAKGGDFAGAEKEFRRALELNPRSVKALTNLGLIFHYQGDETRAREYWQRALVVDPNAEDPKRALAGMVR